MNTATKNIVVLLFFTAVPFLFDSKSIAQTIPLLNFNPVVTSGLSSPVDIVNAGDGSNRLFIIGQGGTVRILSGGVLLPGNFLSIPDSITSGGERGLLSLAFHPNYANNRYFFIYYTNTAGDIRITRYQTSAGNPNLADKTTGVVVLTIPHPSFSNHNGGKLNFGPDGNLYFGTGDGGSGGDPNNNAQNGNSLLGKLIRINVDNFTTPPYYSIPPDNPYINDPNVRDEIFALGLRNPWRWSFDKLTHDAWIADVGQGAWEEVNVRGFASSGGINYGWRCYEGNAPYNTSGCQPQNSYISPIFVYPHNSATGGYSVTGGYVYRGLEFAAMYGYYICADYVSGNVWLIRPNAIGSWNVSQQSGLPGSIAGFGEAENGDLYAAALNGTVYKVITSTLLPVTLQQFTVTPFTAYNEVQWKTLNEQSVSHFEIEFSNDSINFSLASRVNALNIPPNNSYTYRHFISGFTKLFYRLKITNRDGRFIYSDTVQIDKKISAFIKIHPNLVTNHQLTIFSEKQLEQVIIFSAEGQKVSETKLNNISGIVNIPLPHLQAGLYFVRIKLKDAYFTEKIFIHQVK